MRPVDPGAHDGRVEKEGRERALPLGDEETPVGGELASLFIDRLAVLPILAKFAGEQRLRGRIVGMGVGKVHEALEALGPLELQRMDEARRPAPLLCKIRQHLTGCRAPVLSPDHGGQPQDRIDMVGPSAANAR